MRFIILHIVLLGHNHLWYIKTLSYMNHTNEGYKPITLDLVIFFKYTLTEIAFINFPDKVA